MYERYPHGSLSIDFGQVLLQALREGHTIELQAGTKRGLVVVVDGVALPNETVGFPTESFGYDVTDLPLETEEQVETVQSLVAALRSRRTDARNKTASTDQHTAAEGLR